MACSVRSLIPFLLLASACLGDEPGVGTGTPNDDSGTSTGPGEVESSSSTLDPDSTGSTTGDEGFTEICDGSEGLRLAMVLGGGGAVENEIEREIGFYYLYVLGTCEYFALPADGGVTWPDARSGTLDAATAEQLSRALDYGNLAEVAGSWGTEGVSDGSTLLVSDGALTMACYAGCEDGPEGARALWGEMSWIDTLWEQGTALDGALRISVIGWRDSTLDELGPPWPLDVDPWSLAIDGDVDPPPEAGDSRLLDDPEHVAILKELREQYRTGMQPKGLPNALDAYGHLTFEDAGGQDLFQVWIRDALPIEDAMGLVPLPSP